MSPSLFGPLIIMAILIPGAISVHASPAFEIIAPDKDIEKAHTFQLLVRMTTDQKLESISIAPIYPEGFCMEAVLTPGVTAKERAKAERPAVSAAVPECTGVDDIALISSLEKSSMIIPFTVYPPDSNGMPATGDKRSYYSTRERKIFAFNYTYTVDHGDGRKDTGHASQQIELRYTTTIGYYLFFGLFGVLLGYIVKTVTRDREAIASAMVDVRGLGPGLNRLSSLLFVERLPLLLTLMVIGFSVLISMAQESLPVSSWHQAIALGIGLGILGDEKLISRIK